MSQPGTVGVPLGRGLTYSSFHTWGDDEGLRESSSSIGFVGVPKEDDVPIASTSGQSKSGEQRLLEDSKKSYNAIDTLKEMCTVEGLSLLFQEPAAGNVNRRDWLAQVEVAGQILGKGSGPTWEAAKLQNRRKPLLQEPLFLKINKHIKQELRSELN